MLCVYISKSKHLFKLGATEKPHVGFCFPQKRVRTLKIKVSSSVSAGAKMIMSNNVFDPVLTWMFVNRCEETEG